MDITWNTKTINVFKADSFMSLVQSTPTVIYDCDLNSLRLSLKDIEDSSEGMAFERTNKHNTEVSLGGLTFARVIEIINGYSITFEDGAYAVNLVGANSNVGDKVNVNQVSVRSQNSAGLISSPAIEYASFNGAVCIDPINGVGGTLYNIGTPENPSNNLADAKLIADFRGFYKLRILESMTIANIDLSDFVISGRSHVKTIITMADSAILNDITVENCNITGILDGGTHIKRCSVGDITYVNGHVHDCGLYGTIVLSGNEEAVLANCFTLDQDLPLTVDMGGSGQDLAMPNYSGLVTIKNLTSSSEEIGIGLNAGMIILEDTITAGTIIIGGNGLLMHTQTGTEVVNSDGLINKTGIANAVWNDLIVDYTITGSFGKELATKADISGGISVTAETDPVVKLAAILNL